MEIVAIVIVVLLILFGLGVFVGRCISIGNPSTSHQPDSADFKRGA